jgi:hypothetical protein
MKLTKDNFQKYAELQGYKVTPEFQFAKSIGRKWRSDWLVEKGDKQVLVEYDGYDQFGVSRHGTLIGRTNDVEKYNMANIMGYHILTYTKINFPDVFANLESYFKVA